MFLRYSMYNGVCKSVTKTLWQQQHGDTIHLLMVQHVYRSPLLLIVSQWVMTWLLKLRIVSMEIRLNKLNYLLMILKLLTILIVISPTPSSCKDVFFHRSDHMFHSVFLLILVIIFIWKYLLADLAFIIHQLLFFTHF